MGVPFMRDAGGGFSEVLGDAERGRVPWNTQKNVEVSTQGARFGASSIVDAIG